MTDTRFALLVPNIRTRGRLIRGAASLVFAIAGGILIGRHHIVGGLLLASAAFLLFEAMRGWCALRACGVRTKF